MQRFLINISFSFLLFILACSASTDNEEGQQSSDPYVIVLGIAQDGGVPQTNCMKDCCIDRWGDPSKKELVSCLGIVDPETGEKWLIDATPDISEQLYLLNKSAKNNELIDGVFLTHAHIGHYTGLMHFGREAMGTKKLKVHAMPRMKEFLGSNGPWDQLVSLKNIELQDLETGAIIRLNDRLSITPILVPHRDEYSETVGYLIEGPNKAFLYIPDIDKWELWNFRLAAFLLEIDIAIIDGSFYNEGELPGRNMADIPHPFVVETMKLLETTPDEIRDKVHFIHFNHTNPILNPDSTARREVKEAGYHITAQGNIYTL